MTSRRVLIVYADLFRPPRFSTRWISANSVRLSAPATRLSTQFESTRSIDSDAITGAMCGPNIVRSSFTLPQVSVAVSKME